LSDLSLLTPSENREMIPKVQDTPLLRIRYHCYRLRVGRNRAACARRTSRVPVSYGIYRQSLWLKRKMR